MAEVLKENELYDSDYELPQGHRWRWLLLIVLALITGFFLNFPLKTTLDHHLRQTLLNLPGCPISYDSLDFSFFPPKLQLNSTSLSARCLGGRGAPLVLRQTHLQLRSFGIFPPSVKLEVATEYSRTSIKTFARLGFSEQTLEIKDSKLSIADLLLRLPQPIKARGLLTLNGEIALADRVPQSGILFIQSDDLFIEGQNIQGLDLPAMNVGALAIKGNLANPSRFDIETFLLGGNASPIRSSFSGYLNLNARNFQQSQINLVGETAFEESFLEEFSFIKFFLNQFNLKNGFYQIKIAGPLYAPVPSTY